jgi:hypothetical protein
MNALYSVRKKNKNRDQTSRDEVGSLASKKELPLNQLNQGLRGSGEGEVR